MNNSIKEEIHKLVDMCKEEVLYEVKKRLTKNENDWWDTDFTKEEQDEMLEDVKQAEMGNYISNEEVMKKFEIWKQK